MEHAEQKLLEKGANICAASIGKTSFQGLYGTSPSHFTHKVHYESCERNKSHHHSSSPGVQPVNAADNNSIAWTREMLRCSRLCLAKS